MIIGICDDLKEECIKAKSFLENSKVVDISDDTIQIYSPAEVKCDLEEGLFCCDIMIMDIEFEKEEYDGIVLSTKINEVAPMCQIVYLTHIIEFAPEVYETEHCYFVMKANKEIMLPRAIEKAKRCYEKNLEDKFIEIVSDSHKVLINQKDILYIERQNRTTIFHTVQRDYSCYKALLAISRKLEDDFVRCHGGFIVNLRYVTYLGTDTVTINDSIDIPIGGTFKEQVKQAYLKRWMQQV